MKTCILIKENEARIDWWRRFENLYIFGILRTRCFSSMLPSMPKGEIVSMNVDDTTMGENFEHYKVMTCCIHDYVCHWCQHSSKSMKIGRVVDCDLCIMDNSLIV